MDKVLIITNHRKGRSPAQRFRFEQYLTYLKDHNFEIHFSNLISKKDDKILYSKGKLPNKFLIHLKSWKTRISNMVKRNDFDIVFIHREALFTPSTYFEKKFANSNAKVIVDFDDAIWLPNVSAGNKALQIFKKPQKSDEVFGYADMIFAGNQYLADYASQFCNNVKIVPTTIDTNYHFRTKWENKKKICIGWTGTQTTLKYLDFLQPVFVRLNEKYGDKIYFKIICDTPWEFEGFKVKNEKWSKAQEIEQLEEIDIGIMPLTDDQWSRGKCGFKGLQYMAMECAAILSPVGVNQEIITHSKNGFLAKTEEEWFSYLSQLIENKELRLQFGKEARKTVEDKYSVNAYKDLYVKYLKEIIVR